MKVKYQILMSFTVLEKNVKIKLINNNFVSYDFIK